MDLVVDLLIYHDISLRAPFPGAKTIQRIVSGAEAIVSKPKFWNHAPEVFIQDYDSDSFGGLGYVGLLEGKSLGNTG